MKKLQSLKGAKALNKKEQQSINGGAGPCTNTCSNWTFGDPCVDSCGNSGVCTYNLTQTKWVCIPDIG